MCLQGDSVTSMKDRAQHTVEKQRKRKYVPLRRHQEYKHPSRTKEMHFLMQIFRKNSICKKDTLGQYLLIPLPYFIHDRIKSRAHAHI